MSTKTLSSYLAKVPYHDISIQRWLVIIFLFFLSGLVFYYFVTLDFPQNYIVFLLGIPFVQYLFAPLFRVIKFYKYLTPMVLAIVYSKKNIEIHNGLTIDYLMNMKWEDRGPRAQKILWLNYFQAFLKLIEMVEDGIIPPDADIKGHSYFFNDRTAERFGFTVEPAKSFWKWNSVLNGLEITLLYSYSQGKFAIPKLTDVKTAATTGEKLASKKELIQGLANRFEKELATN